MNARTQRLTTIAGTMAILFGSVSCGDVARTGRSPVMLVVDSLTAANGPGGQFNGSLQSDVLTKGSVINDIGKMTMRIVLKDLGSPAGEATPTPINQVTVTRYHVWFHRSDGRNQEGVDVPYAFDGGATATITAQSVDVIFELVRHSAKLEAPLMALANHGGRIEISTIADVTFYGKDLAGNEVQATGSISVDFGDFADSSS